MFHQRNLLVSVFILIAGFLAAPPSVWAVVGTISVQDPSGQPIPEATITLTPPSGPPIQTKTSPEGMVDVEEGTYTMGILIGSEQITRTVTVKPGKTTIVEVPGRRSSSYNRSPVRPGTNVFIEPQTESLDDMTRTASAEKRTLTVRDTSGNVLLDQTNSFQADQTLLDQRNDDLVQSMDIQSVAAGVNIGLGGFGTPSYNDNAIVPAFFSSRSSEGKLVYPFISLMIGRAEAEVEFGNAQFTQRFKGDGTLFGIGGGMLVFFGNSNWFGSGEYRFDRLSELHMDVSPIFAVQDALITRQEIVFDYDSHLIEGIAGYNFEHFAPFGGIRRTTRSIQLDADLGLDGSANFPGLSVIGTLEFSEEFEENTTEGVVGVDFRIGHLIAGVETSFDGDNYRFRGRAGFGF